MDIEVVSVTRRPQPKSRTAAAVYVITAEEIRRSGARSIPELLRMVPGLHVARINTTSGPSPREEQTASTPTGCW
jgi:iron complex outermembrane receptor protein